MKNNCQNLSKGFTPTPNGIKNIKLAKVRPGLVRGFTFIETILYVAIVSIILSSFVMYGWNIIQGGAKSSHQEEANSAARYLSQRIKYEIRNASGINSVTAGQITLAETTGAVNPTIINYSGGKVTIQQGASAAVDLNPTGTNITSFNFTNLSSDDNKTKNIQFTFTLESNYPSLGNIKETVSIEGDAELRSN